MAKSPEEIAEERIQKAAREGAHLLNLSNLGLRKVPESFGQLVHLKKLFLRHNLLSVVPESIGQLVQLEMLDLWSNQLGALPQSIGQCVQLQKLDLSHNRLTALPEWIGKLVNLRKLYVEDNQLSALPDSIGQLVRLEKVSFAANQLRALPESLGQLGELQRLFLQENELSTLPQSLKNLKMLQFLFLHYSPALQIPHEVLNTFNPRKILDYYFEQRVAARPLNEVRLLLVGRGGAGKTSIVRRLIENKFNLRQKETPGIAIDPWEVKCGNVPIRVHVWDFAGQVITHAAHQFFFTHCALYVLVLTGREDSERQDAEYWLRLIRAFATDSGNTSPVIVVLNKSKSHPCKVDRYALQEKYPFIVDFVETDCAKPKKDGTGIRKLHTVLSETMAKMPEVRRTFPAAWFEVKEKLALMRTTLKQDYLSYADYRALCVQHGVTDESKQDSLAGVLHALGIALNYGDDVRLRNATILNPHWVTSGIYTLLREAATDTGEMTLKDVARVLPQEKPEMRRYLVELMRRFDLAFPLTEDGEDWLVPQRLPPSQPKLGKEWQEPGLTKLRYEYSALPEGLVPRFITRTYPLSEKQPRWMNGVVLELDGARALVRADPAERTISVAVRGPADVAVRGPADVAVSGPADARRRLASLVRDDFRRIHAEIPGLNPAETIELENPPGESALVKSLEEDEKQGQASSISTLQGTKPVDHTKELNRVSSPEARDPDQWKAKVFISYPRKDLKQRDELIVRLKLLRAQGLVDPWSDFNLTASDEWDKTLKQKLEEADIFALLVNDRFLASDYIREVEMKRALERRQAGDAELVSIIVENCDWKYTPLKDYHALPPDGKPIKNTKPTANAWHAVSEGLRKVLEKMRSTRAANKHGALAPLTE